MVTTESMHEFKKRGSHSHSHEVVLTLIFTPSECSQIFSPRFKMILDNTTETSLRLMKNSLAL